MNELLSQHAAIDITIVPPVTSREAESVREHAIALVEQNASALGMDGYAAGILIDLIRDIKP